MRGDKGMIIPPQNPADAKGEIDTRAPFSSVKAAASLFGEVRTRRPKSGQIEIIQTPPIPKEPPLFLVKKELNKYKELLENAEKTRAHGLAELERVRETVEELTNKLIAVNESKDIALEAAEFAKAQTRRIDVRTVNKTAEENSCEWELENATERYTAVTVELGTAKQELRKIKKDLEALAESRFSAAQQEAEAKQLFDVNNAKVMELSKEIGVAQGSLMHMQTATEQVEREVTMILSEKAATERTYRQVLKETLQKFASLNKDFDPEHHKNLEAKLSRMNFEIAAAQNLMQNIPTTDLDSGAVAAGELHGARDILQELAKEECSLMSLRESLKAELEATKAEHAKLKNKDAETESKASDLHLKLQECKADLEAAKAGETKESGSPSDDLMPTIQQLSADSQTALLEAEEMKRNAKMLQTEAEAARLALERAENKLQSTLKDAEAAKSAEVRALDILKDLPDEEDVAQASTPAASESNITISKEEYESLVSKVEDSEKLAEMREVAAMGSESEANKKMEAVQKETEDVVKATKEALRRAHLAEAAKKAVEGELRRLRGKETANKDANTPKMEFVEAPTSEFVETPTRELHVETPPTELHVETQMPGERIPPKPAPQAVKPGEKAEENRRFGRPISRRAFMANFGGIFHRKKSLSGGSPHQ